MVSFIFGVLLLYGTFIFGACTPAIAPAPDTKSAPVTGKTGPAWQEKWEKTVAAAKKEGEVLLYGNVVPATREALVAALQEKFGIKLDMVVVIGAEGGTRLNNEYRAGIHRVDAIIAGATTLITMVKPEGNLLPIEPLLILPEVKDPKLWYDGGVPFSDKDTQVLGFIRAYQPGMIRSTELVKDGEIVSYRDLLKPQWKGKVVMYDPTIPGSANAGLSSLVAAWGYDQALEFLRALVKQEAVLTRDYRQQVEWVARGKYPIALWARPETINEFIPMGAPIAPVKLAEGGLVTAGASVIGMPKNPPHPNAATVFLNWLLTKEGQTIYSQTLNSPSWRLDVPIPKDLSQVLLTPPGEKPFLDIEETSIKGRSKLMAGAREILTPLMK